MSTSNLDITQSPCIGECELNEEEVCTGCHRSLDEINAWSKACDDERLNILQNVEQRKPS
ncbi:DUF1289 domain-containing protein [Pseudomonadota bacterium]